MDYNSLPHFCRKESYKTAASHDCYSLDHSFHQELYNYMKQRALGLECAAILKHDAPGDDTNRPKLVKATESELHKIGNQPGLASSFISIPIMGHDWTCPSSRKLFEALVSGLDHLCSSSAFKWSKVLHFVKVYRVIITNPCIRWWLSNILEIATTSINK